MRQPPRVKKNKIVAKQRDNNERQKIIFMQLFKLIVGIYGEEDQMANQLQRQNKKMIVICFMLQWNILHELFESEEGLFIAKWYIVYDYFILRSCLCIEVDQEAYVVILF